MALELIQSLITNALGLSLQQLFLMLTYGLVFILSAFDIRMASIIGLVLLVVQLIYFYLQNADITLNVLSILVILIIMSFSMFILKKKEFQLT